METAFPPCRPICTEWKSLCRAAIFETDKSVGSIKAAEAERAILARERELFYGEGTLEEKEALEDALYVVRALRNAWQYTEAA
jgi:hypothetical protein